MQNKQGKLKTSSTSIPNLQRKKPGVLMRTRRLWTAIGLFAILLAFFYCFILQDTASLRALIAFHIEKESSCSPTADTVDDGCLDVVYGNYCVLSLPSEEERSNINLGSLTLCTQGTVEFLQHVAVLCQRWGGPISVAVYSPPLDFPGARSLVDTLHRCDFCIRHWVSWHFFGKQKPGDCSAISSNNVTEKRKSEGTYPINVGRNVARQRARTPYVFSLDIELYPSPGVLPKFERMIRSLPNATSGDPQVWVLPVFEVRSEFSAPTTKFQLKQMHAKRQAISFHLFRCNICHMIPNLKGWLGHESQLSSEVSESFEALRVWTTVKRNRKERLGDWEPFFIGTKRDPEFDIRLSWEGKQNKMQVAYEMCLRNYNFHIVDNAFLVHAPGINVYNASKDKKRFKYMRENKKWISLIKKDLKRTYPSHLDC